MSVLLAVLMIGTLVFADQVRERHEGCADLSNCAFRPGSHSEKKRKCPILPMLIWIVFTLSLLAALLLIAGRMMIPAEVSSVSAQVSDPLVQEADRQQTRAVLADVAGLSDVETLKAHKLALQTELKTLDHGLATSPSDRELRSKRRLTEILLCNTGHTGVSDRLAEFAEAQRLVDANSAFSSEEKNIALRAVADLRTSAMSWKTGALASAGSQLGLQWDGSKGLVANVQWK